MARINLLPWRNELRRDRQRRFVFTLIGTLAIGAIVVYLAMSFFDQKIRAQNQRNDSLRREIATLEQRIVEIEQLERTRDNLLSRKRIIEELQASRSQTVQLLDQLAKSIPFGVTLTSITQQGRDLTLQGTSQSNARVSAYLQNLQATELFINPDLMYVRAASEPGSGIEPYEFSIFMRLHQEGDEEGLDTVEEVEG